MQFTISTLAFLASASSVAAHSTFQEFWSGDVDQAGTCARLPLSNSPVTSVTSTDIVCNAGTTPVAALCPVTAGQNITVEMHAQPNDRSCTNEALGGNHFGPVIVYMGKVDDATSGTPTSWFKISEEGYNPTTKKWGTDTLNANCGKVPVTVPSSIAPGNYLVRAEAIALHTAGSEGGAQFYMTCFQVNVESSGTVNPTGVSFPGAYSATDPGILINIYDEANIANYQIPGPALFTGSDSGSIASPVASSTAAGVVVSTSALVPASSSVPAAVEVSSEVPVVASSTAAGPVVTSAAVPTTLQTVVRSSSIAVEAPVTTQESVPTSTQGSAPVATDDSEYDDCE